MRSALHLLTGVLFFATGCLNQVAQLSALSKDGGCDAGFGCGPSALLSISPSSVDFGLTQVHTVATQILTLTNGANVDLEVTPQTLTGPQATLFGMTAVAGTPLRLPAGKSVPIQLSYAPLMSNLDSADSATLTLSTSNGNSRQVPLQGTPLGFCLGVSPSLLNFGFVPPGTAVTRSLQITNSCIQELTLAPTGILDAGTPSAFSVSPHGAWCGCRIAPGENQALDVTFTPPTTGRYDGEAGGFSLDVGMGVGVVPLVGYGGGAAISCVPLSLDFFSAAVNSTVTQQLFCTNTGTDVPNHPEAGLILTKLSTSSAVYSAQMNPTSMPASPMNPLTAGHSVQIDVTYAPVSATKDLGTLTLNSNVTDGTPTAPPVVSLSGEGVMDAPCALGVVPQSLSFGNVAVGSSATASFTLSNLGSTECLASGIALSPDCASAFFLPGGPIVSQRLSPAGGGVFPSQLTINVTFTPPGDGVFKCALLAGTDGGGFGIAGAGSG